MSIQAGIGCNRRGEKIVAPLIGMKNRGLGEWSGALLGEVNKRRAMGATHRIRGSWNRGPVGYRSYHIGKWVTIGRIVLDESFETVKESASVGLHLHVLVVGSCGLIKSKLATRIRDDMRVYLKVCQNRSFGESRREECFRKLLC